MSKETKTGIRSADLPASSTVSVLTALQRLPPTDVATDSFLIKYSKFHPGKASKAQRGSRGIALLVL